MHRPQASALGSGLCTGETLVLLFSLQQLIQFPGHGVGEPHSGGRELVGWAYLTPAGVHLFAHPMILFLISLTHF
jgi:hypothetical protein